MPANNANAFKAKRLESFVCGLFQATGVTQTDSKTIFSSLLYAEQRGVFSHGFMRVPYYMQRLENGGINPRPHIRIISEKKAAAVLDGDNGMGQISGTAAMRKALGLAAKHSTGIVSVRGGSHCGALSYFTSMAAEKGYVGLAISNTSAMMAPTGGTQSLLGNNPVSIALPSAGKFAVILDMALSVTAQGKFVLAQQEGKQIPLGLAIDRKGVPTTDPAEALAGTVLPFGGYKGYGMAFVADILCGILSGRSFGPGVGSLLKGDNSKATDNSFFFWAFKVSALFPLDKFKQGVSKYVDLIKASPRAEGCEEIYVPGEKEWQYYQRNKNTPIALAPKLHDSLRSLAARLGVRPF